MYLYFGTFRCKLMPKQAQTENQIERLSGMPVASQLMPKQAQNDNQVDRLSNLPSEVLCHIFSFLPFKDVVRTSVLSTRWKPFFESVPWIDIVTCFPPAEDPTNDTKFMSFAHSVDEVLLLRDSCLAKLRLHLSGRVIDTALIRRWVPALLRHGISELDLSIKTHYLPACMFTCKTLKVLKLNRFYMNVPADVSFPNLKTLHLDSVKFRDDASAKKFFSACHVLEDLVLRSCHLAKTRHGISELDLSIKTHYLPACIFTCKTLKVLKLNRQGLYMNVPTDVCFPNLKILHLDSVKFQDDASAQTIFSACLVLEDLVFRSCYFTETRHGISLYGISKLHVIKTHNLPACIFTCKTLNVLKLNTQEFDMNVSDDVCFLNLKILHLDSVRFQDDASAQTLFSACLVLEDLVLQSCEFSEHWMPSVLNIFNHTLKRLTISQMNSGYHLKIVLDTPRLVYFDYDDKLAASFSFINCGSLEEAHISTSPGNKDAANDASVLDFMKGISVVRLLHLAYCSMAVLNDCGERMPMFHNLIHLTIDASPGDWEGLGKLLINSPKLETVTITLLPGSKSNYPLWKSNYPLWTSQHKEMRFCSFSCLEAISIYNFDCHYNQMEMIRYFMKRSGVLRNLNLHLINWLGKDRQLKLKTKLFKFRIKSHKCQVNVVGDTEVDEFFLVNA